MDASIYANLLDDIEDDVKREEVAATTPQCDEKLQKILDTIQEVGKIDTAPPPPTPPKPIQTQKKQAVRERNLLDPEIRARFKQDLIDTDGEILTRPKSTTITLQGGFSDLYINEKTDIDKLDTYGDVVEIKCNYGHKIAPGYVKPCKKKTSNRGRKRKVKEEKKKQRKVQGTGEAFSSQITFVVRSTIWNEKTDAWKEFEYKVFRNGEFIFPYAQPQYIDEIIDGAHKVAELLNIALNYDEPEDVPRIKLVYISPVMINYRFHLQLERGQLIDLAVLKHILLAEKAIDEGKEIKTLEDIAAMMAPQKQKKRRGRPKIQNGQGTEAILVDNGPAAEHRYCLDYIDIDVIRGMLASANDNFKREKHPPIFDVKYSREDTSLFLRMSTPIVGNPDKQTCISVFPGNDITGSDEYGGKINILGALDEKITRQIYKFLLSVFERYYDVLVVEPYTTQEYIIEDPRAISNILLTEPIEQRKRESLWRWTEAIEGVSEDDVKEIESFIDTWYASEVKATEAWFHQLCEVHPELMEYFYDK